ncbi:hypothetical protein CEXT_668271 [Caerostris extrusa]|uniref:Uncharacterized protein n=1 Tax=Caerostris extrusa TaxID=172846 RepID=A0AAV4Y4J1_CAEEX|nr:hypothetical protein CEXT_668271 [Caerostris extrusa]
MNLQFWVQRKHDSKPSNMKIFYLCATVHMEIPFHSTIHKGHHNGKSSETAFISELANYCLCVSRKIVTLPNTELNINGSFGLNCMEIFTNDGHGEVGISRKYCTYCDK